jgi:XTP/dITP diphosphohydrolase
MKLLVATTNPGKVREIAGMLQGLPIELVTLVAFPQVPEVEETGATFEENARQKALYYAAASGLPTVTDDSGLEIDALDNAPGVHSARWHGTEYPVKFRKIYELLDARGLDTSSARFVCRVALAEGDRVTYEAEGTVAGQISREPRGTNGFGYDPIFFYPPFGCTLAELDPVRKASVSHRGQAFSALKQYLRARLSVSTL